MALNERLHLGAVGGLEYAEALGERLSRGGALGRVLFRHQQILACSGRCPPPSDSTPSGLRAMIASKRLRTAAGG